MIVDLFAGSGGWSEGLRMIGLTDVGIEWDAAACQTRAAAGHATIRADVAQYPTAPFAGKVEGLILSPPCPDFSVAGKGAGIHGESGHLVTEVMRWADALRPEWIACEQVPPVLPIWKEYAAELRAMRYSAWSGILCAADYGVPQTRRRAFLLASRVRPALPPEPTHAQDPEAGLFGTLEPWVSMADALGWGQTIPAWTLSPGTKAGGADSALMGGSGTRRAVRDRRQQSDGEPRRMVPDNEPAPTLTGIAGSKGQWVWRQPATTVAGDSRVWPPGHKINQGDIDRLGEEEARARYGDRAGTEAIRLTVEEALVLQSFDPSYPVQGTKSKRFEQVGNAVPPLVAAHIVAALKGAQPC